MGIEWRAGGKSRGFENGGAYARQVAEAMVARWSQPAVGRDGG